MNERTSHESAWSIGVFEWFYEGIALVKTPEFELEFDKVFVMFLLSLTFRRL